MSVKYLHFGSFDNSVEIIKTYSANKFLVKLYYEDDVIEYFILNLPPHFTNYFFSENISDMEVGNI